MSESALDSCVARHLEQSALTFRLDEELGTHHGLSWQDFVLLAQLEAGAIPAPQLAARLGLRPSRLLMQLLPLEKTGLVAREVGADGKRRVNLRPGGSRLLGEARETAAAVCDATWHLREASSA